jgi:hypothetical protein
MTIADTLSIRLVLFVSGLQFRIQVPVDILTGFQRSHDRLTRIVVHVTRMFWTVPRHLHVSCRWHTRGLLFDIICSRCSVWLNGKLKHHPTLTRKKITEKVATDARLDKKCWQLPPPRLYFRGNKMWSRIFVTEGPHAFTVLKMRSRNSGPQNLRGFGPEFWDLNWVWVLWNLLYCMLSSVGSLRFRVVCKQRSLSVNLACLTPSFRDAHKYCYCIGPILSIQYILRNAALITSMPATKT